MTREMMIPSTMTPFIANVMKSLKNLNLIKEGASTEAALLVLRRPDMWMKPADEGMRQVDRKQWLQNLRLFHVQVTAGLHLSQIPPVLRLPQDDEIQLSIPDGEPMFVEEICERYFDGIVAVMMRGASLIVKGESVINFFSKKVDAIAEVDDRLAQEELSEIAQQVSRACLGDQAAPLFKKMIDLSSRLLDPEQSRPEMVFELAPHLMKSGLGDREQEKLSGRIIETAVLLELPELVSHIAHCAVRSGQENNVLFRLIGRTITAVITIAKKNGERCAITLRDISNEIVLASLNPSEKQELFAALIRALEAVKRINMDEEELSTTIGDISNSIIKSKLEGQSLLFLNRLSLLAVDLKDGWLRSRAFNDIALSMAQVGQKERAVEFFDQAIEASRKTGGKQEHPGVMSKYDSTVYYILRNLAAAKLGVLAVPLIQKLINDQRSSNAMRMIRKWVATEGLTIPSLLPKAGRPRRQSKK